jgi:predicted porin
MKKSLIALAVLGAFAGVASAQSSVTMFGIVDLAARYAKNGSAGSVKSLNSGGLSTSRLGFRGVEDLGDGLKAGFYLESGINPDTGTVNTAKFFDRRATVSLSNQWGELRLGRDNNPTALNTYSEPFGAVGLGTVGNFTYGPTAALGSGATTTLRNDNSIGYFLPGSLGGVYGSAMVAAGEGIPGNKYYGARLGWGAGPIDVAVGYGKTKTASNTDYDQYNVKGHYDFGVVKLIGLYDVKKFGALTQKTTMLGATAPMGLGAVRFSYALNNRAGGVAGSGFNDADDSKLIALGYLYNLSKRTALYTTAARISNSGAARSAVTYTPPAGMRGGESSSGIEFGVSHQF